MSTSLKHMKQELRNALKEQENISSTMVIFYLFFFHVKLSKKQLKKKKTYTLLHIQVNLEDKVNDLSAAILQLQHEIKQEEEEKETVERQIEREEEEERRAYVAGVCVEEAVERLVEYGLEPRKILYISPDFVRGLEGQCGGKEEERGRREKERNLYSLEDLVREEFVRERGLNERELERYLGEEGAEGVLGEGWGKLPRWKQWEVKKGKGLVPSRFMYLCEQNC